MSHSELSSLGKEGLTLVATVFPHHVKLIPSPPFENAKIKVWIKPLMAIPTSNPASVK
jgi:hypothetical protein